MIDPTADLEPVTAGALRRFLSTYSVVPDLPISIAVRAFTTVVCSSTRPGGDGGGPGAGPGDGRASSPPSTRPDDLIVAACVGPEQRRDWDWLKWLPHALHPTDDRRARPRRLVVGSLTGAGRAARGPGGASAPGSRPARDGPGRA